MLRICEVRLETQPDMRAVLNKDYTPDELRCKPLLGGDGEVQYYHLPQFTKDCRLYRSIHPLPWKEAVLSKLKVKRRATWDLELDTLVDLKVLHERTLQQGKEGDAQKAILAKELAKVIIIGEKQAQEVEKAQDKAERQAIFDAMDKRRSGRGAVGGSEPYVA